jgi:hypothetical protein
MKIEISTKQFNLIQDEIIKLEEELPFIIESKDKWNTIHTKDRIDYLKEVLEKEEIEI